MIFYRKFQTFSFIFFGVFLSIIFSSEVSADAKKNFDGYWWSTLPHEFQLGFILGYQKGFKMALGELIARDKIFPGSMQNLSADALEDQFRLRSQYPCGEIAQELDNLYENEANKPIYIYSAITILLMSSARNLKNLSVKL